MFYPYDPPIDDDDTPTWPPPGSADLVIEDKYEPLFTSAVWTIRASIAGVPVVCSRDSSTEHSASYIRRWVREMIRRKRGLLSAMGVDVIKEYVKWGGHEDDID